MVKTAGFATLDVPTFSLKEVRRFNKVATIRDETGFLAELNKLVRETAESAERATTVPAAVRHALSEKAQALKANMRWEPSGTDIQRGRALMLHEFGQPQNLSLPEFARLAHKSRQQIYKDIAARRLLALNVGARGQRLPDWQLESVPLELTQAVLADADDVDAWTLYHALSEPLDALQGLSPVKAVRRGNLGVVVKAVLNALGIHGRVATVERA